MSSNRFAELRARSAPRSGDTYPGRKKKSPEDEPEADEGENEEEDEMSDETNTEEKEAKAADAATKAANERMQAVFASEHYAGNQTTANKLLLNANLSSDDIIGVLADLPKPEKQSSANPTDDAAAKKMNEVINSEKNAELSNDETPSNERKGLMKSSMAKVAKERAARKAA